MLIIENDFLKIELNKHGACLKSIFDKRKIKNYYISLMEGHGVVRMLLYFQ